MTRKKTILAICVTVLATAGTVLVAADEAPLAENTPQRPGLRRLAQTRIGRFIIGAVGRKMAMKAELDISDDQREEIKVIVEGHKAKMIPLAQTIARAKRALRDAVVADQVNEQAIRDASEQLGKAVGDAAVAVSEMAAEIKGVLTADQWDRVKQFHSQNDQAVDKFFENSLAQ